MPEAMAPEVTIRYSFLARSSRSTSARMRSVSIRPPGAIRLVPPLMTRRTVKSLAIYQPIAGACDFLLDLTRDLILKGEALRNLAYAARVLETGAQAVHARSFAALRMMP